MGRSGARDVHPPRIPWDYTTWLNITFLALAAALIVRFVRTGGVAMLRMMGGSPDGHEHHHMDAPASSAT